MAIRTKEYIGYIILMLLVTLFPMFIGDTTIDYKLFVHDFSQEGMLRRFLYHEGLMLQPTILTWIIVRNTTGHWNTIAVITFLWFIKDCIDVVINNNLAPTLFYDLTGYLLIVILTLLWRKLNMSPV